MLTTELTKLKKKIISDTSIVLILLVFIDFCITIFDAYNLLTNLLCLIILVNLTENRKKDLMIRSLPV